MKAVKIQLLLQDCADFVSMELELPSPMPEVTSDQLRVKFDVQKGKGQEYLEKNFPGVPVEVIDIRRERHT